MPLYPLYPLYVGGKGRNSGGIMVDLKLEF
jgi:hypothetical protein